MTRKGEKMYSLTYTLKNVPDLTLAKYQSLGENGIEGVLERHATFLRQWQGLSKTLNINIQLVYIYNPDKCAGEKLCVYLRFVFEDERCSEKIKKIMQSSSMEEFFDFYLLDKNEEEQLCNMQYSHQVCLKKLERQKITEDNSNLTLFTVEEYEANKKARLYELLRIMESLNEPIVYTVTLQGIDAYEKAYQALEKPISLLRKRTYGITDNVVLKKEQQQKNVRDVAVEETLKCYEDFLSTTIKSPCFRTNLCVYANNSVTASIVMNVICGEAIEKGNVDFVYEPESCYYPLKEFKIRQYSKIMPDSLKFWPTVFSLEEVLPFFCFPTLYDGENVDIVKETSPVLEGAGILLGKTLQGYDIHISQKGFMKHAFVCGVPGSGKTNTMLHIANSLWHNREKKFGELIERKIPFLVLEPAKKEYRELSLFDIPELIIFSPNANTKFPLQINPFEFPRGLTLSEHINMLRQVFEGAFPIQPPAPFILDQAIEKIYINKGWNTYDINMGDKPYPRISELYDEFKVQLEQTSYDGEIRGNIQSVLEMRIGSLMRREKKDIFDVEHSILAPEEWLTKPIVMELESLGKETSNFITLLICTLIRESLKVNPMEGIETKRLSEERIETWKPLRHVIFIEEAHNLIASQNEMESRQDSNPKIAATECIVDMLKEVRALREGIIIADQLPTAMAMDVIKNSNIKVVHRLTSGDDRGLVGSTMSASELQLEQVSTYLPGQALITYEGLMRPFEMRICNLENHGIDTPDDTTLYEIMKNKPGQQEIYQRLEYRFWGELQHKIQIALRLENAQREALRTYEFDGKSPIQKEEFFEQCLTKYQALELMKQSFEMKSLHLPTIYIDKESVEKTRETIKQIGQKYREEVAFLVDKNL